jgi:hypothetical protein
MDTIKETTAGAGTNNISINDDSDDGSESGAYNKSLQNRRL